MMLRSGSHDQLMRHRPFVLMLVFDSIRFHIPDQNHDYAIKAIVDGQIHSARALWSERLSLRNYAFRSELFVQRP